MFSDFLNLACKYSRCGMDLKSTKSPLWDTLHWIPYELGCWKWNGSPAGWSLNKQIRLHNSQVDNKDQSQTLLSTYYTRYSAKTFLPLACFTLTTIQGDRQAYNPPFYFNAFLKQILVASGLIAIAFLAVEHRLVAVAHEFSCPTACGIFLHQGLSPCPMHWQWLFNHWATREVPLTPPPASLSGQENWGLEIQFILQIFKKKNMCRFGFLPQVCESIWFEVILTYWGDTTNCPPYLFSLSVLWTDIILWRGTFYNKKIVTNDINNSLSH